jgi:hypothetical protein
VVGWSVWDAILTAQCQLNTPGMFNWHCAVNTAGLRSETIQLGYLKLVDSHRTGPLMSYHASRSTYEEFCLYGGLDVFSRKFSPINCVDTMVSVR